VGDIRWMSYTNLQHQQQQEQEQHLNTSYSIQSFPSLPIGHMTLGMCRVWCQWRHWRPTRFFGRCFRK